jgi:hypothetical protein
MKMGSVTSTLENATVRKVLKESIAKKPIPNALTTVTATSVTTFPISPRIPKILIINKILKIPEFLKISLLLLDL